MKIHALEFRPGWWLDARGILFIEETGTLIAADLHLGYTWVERARGNLFPIVEEDETAAMLCSAVAEWNPARVILAGDIVHGSLPLPEVKRALGCLLEETGAGRELVLVRGNHDRNLEEHIGRALPRTYDAGHCFVTHGDQAVKAARFPVVTGHAHPSISVQDDAATRVRCRCFLSGPEHFVLPAMSVWARGLDVRRSGNFRGLPMIQRAVFDTAYVILGSRVLPVPL